MGRVSDDYSVSEVPVGPLCLPDTKADTLTIKDLLIRCALTLSLYRGQAYDRAVNLQGRRKEVVTQIRNERPAALLVHCFVHSLNIPLQDAGQ